MHDTITKKTKSIDLMNEQKSLLDSPIKIAFGVLAVIAAITTFFSSFTMIDNGEVGIVATFGRVQTEVLAPGFHFKKPWIDDITKVNTQLKGLPVNSEAASSDLQQVTTQVTLQHSLNSAMAAAAYEKVGDIVDLDKYVVEPAVHEALKATTARYTAEQLVTHRDEVKMEVANAINKFIQDTLDDKGIGGAVSIAGVAITDFQFSKTFNDSIEAKVTAGQLAEQAKNNKKKRTTDSEAVFIEKKNAVDALAYSIETESIARAGSIKLEREALKANPGWLKLRAAESWNGELPAYRSGPTPLLQINGGPEAKQEKK